MPLTLKSLGIADMISRSVFVRQSKRLANQTLLFMFVVVGLMAIAYAVGLHITGDGLISSSRNATMWRVLGLIFGVPIVVTAVIIPVALAATRRLRRQLQCPHCQASLTGKHRAGVVIATGNCPSCGVAVLEDDSQAPDSTNAAMPNEDEGRAAHAQDIG